jgi:hypothetical protein
MQTCIWSPFFVIGFPSVFSEAKVFKGKDIKEYMGDETGIADRHHSRSFLTGTGTCLIRSTSSRSTGNESARCIVTALLRRMTYFGFLRGIRPETNCCSGMKMFNPAQVPGPAITYDGSLFVRVVARTRR